MRSLFQKVPYSEITVLGDSPKCHLRCEKSKLASRLLLAAVINHFVTRQSKHNYLFALDQEDYGI